MQSVTHSGSWYCAVQATVAAAAADDEREKDIGKHVPVYLRTPITPQSHTTPSLVITV